jgi:hypothetical protein
LSPARTGWVDIRDATVSVSPYGRICPCIVERSVLFVEPPGDLEEIVETADPEEVTEHLAGLQAGPGISGYAGIVGSLHCGDRVSNLPAGRNPCGMSLPERHIPDRPGTSG